MQLKRHGMTTATALVSGLALLALSGLSLCRAPVSRQGRQPFDFA
jgi:hypothetical protein